MEEIQKGKKIVIVIIAVILLADIVTTVTLASMYLSVGNTLRAMSDGIQGIIRLAFTGVLLFFLYKGKKWAKIMMLILFLVASVIAFLSFDLFTIVLGIIYMGCCMTLIFSSSVKAFLAQQRQ